MKKTVLVFVVFITMFTTIFLGETSVFARVNDSWSGTISHYNVSTGTTVTDYTHIIDVDNYRVSWDSTRKEARYSGYTANYYTSRFMDPNISYSYLSSFTYRSHSSSGAVLGTISHTQWTQANKYSYVLKGAPWRSPSGGSTKNIIGNQNRNIHLTTAISIRCTKDGGSLFCGQRSFTKTF